MDASWGIHSAGVDTIYDNFGIFTGIYGDEQFPKGFALGQNYPNPFNPTTVIKFAIPFESNVNIRFYNSLRQIVRNSDLFQ
jgi:hypothetical protein